MTKKSDVDVFSVWCFHGTLRGPANVDFDAQFLSFGPSICAVAGFELVPFQVWNSPHEVFFSNHAHAILLSAAGVGGGRRCRQNHLRETSLDWRVRKEIRG